MADESARCPTCGEPLEGSKKTTFAKLREATAEALERKATAEARAEEAEVDAADLRERLNTAEAELRRLRVVEHGITTGQIPAVTPPPEGNGG